MRECTLEEIELIDDVFDFAYKNPWDHYGTIEVTLNYPRTAAFKQMQSLHQEVLYELAFKKMLQPFGDKLTVTKYTFEKCYLGNHVHLHAHLLCIKGHYYTNGLILDIVKEWFKQLPRRYSKHFSENNMNYYLQRYTSPSICVQYRDVDPERASEWDKYISKDIV